LLDLANDTQRRACPAAALNRTGGLATITLQAGKALK
jgi:hypothetical protein